jgi:hypothetical protein
MENLFRYPLANDNHGSLRFDRVEHGQGKAGWGRTTRLISPSSSALDRYDRASAVNLPERFPEGQQSECGRKGELFQRLQVGFLERQGHLSALPVDSR